MATFNDDKRDGNTEYINYEGPGDCVQYAAGLMQNKKDWGKRYPSLGLFVGTGVPVVLEAPQDVLGTATHDAWAADQANVGNMMFLTSGPGGVLGDRGGYNFHGATVVASDGDDKITSEACVGTGRWQANFYMYDNVDSFAAVYGGAISIEAPNQSVENAAIRS